MEFFDLFKDKRKEFAPAIYGAFRPRIEVIKKYGKQQLKNIGMNSNSIT